MKLRISAIVFFASLLALKICVAANWFEYDKSVTLIGVIYLEDQYGPPGYGEDPAHDEKVKIRVLKPIEPINVKGIPGDDLDVDTFNDIRRIQLVYQGKLRRYVGKKVKVTGSLFEGHTGHHYTEVLLPVKKIEVLGNR